MLHLEHFSDTLKKFQEQNKYFVLRKCSPTYKGYLSQKLRKICLEYIAEKRSEKELPEFYKKILEQTVSFNIFANFVHSTSKISCISISQYFFRPSSTKLRFFMPSIINNELYRKINNNSIRDNPLEVFVSDAVVVDLAVKFIVYIVLV